MLIPVLICFPFLAAILLAVTKDDRARGFITYVCSAVIMLLTAVMIGGWLAGGCGSITLFTETHPVDMLMLCGELFLMGLVIVLCIRHKRPLIMLLSIAQTLFTAWVELFGPESAKTTHILIDRLSVLMCVVVAFIGGFICIYAVGYMRGYHHHHKEFTDRRTFFFPMLFVFLGAMFGLILSSSLTWIYFFWEITSVVSFLLIGYTRTEEAITNSFRALWMNLLGGCGFAAAIGYATLGMGTLDLQAVVAAGAAVPVVMLAFAALTKSAQLPFSGWLLGAMVAPTPTSALLHSATMVKAGVYLLIRLSPAMAGNSIGTLVAIVGGFTFFAASLMAIAESDAKKVLAFSTISNLGLITACAGVGMEATVWGAVLLVLFHAVSKSMLFQSVGAVENSLGSRDIEDMHGLALLLPKLAAVMALGIAGMFLAPFGMLISKWICLKAFVDSGNLILVLFVAFGSATTMFYWTKYMSKLLFVHKSQFVIKDITEKSEYLSLDVHAVLMVLLCATYPLVSGYVIQPMMQEMFGSDVTILSASDFLIMVVMLASVVVIPGMVTLVSRYMHRDYIFCYMNGINVGDNRNFTDSYGNNKHLYMTNWYMEDLFGQKKLMPLCLLLSACWIVVQMVLIIGGAM